MADRFEYSSQKQNKIEMKEGTDMKKMKKMMALVIAVVMMMAMTISASAATIKVNNPVDDQTYTAYKLFDVTQSGTNYSYTIDAKLSDSTDNPLFTIIKNYGDANANTFTLSNVTGTTIWNVVMDPSFTDANDTNDVKAKAFVTYLNEKIDDLSDEQKVQLAKTLTGTATTVEPGYYFVDSTLGSLCNLQTANAEVTINEKNAKPTIDKTVLEDETNLYGKVATADINQEVTFKLTVNVGETISTLGTGIDKSFKIEDTLPQGLTFKKNSVSVNYGKDSSWETWKQTDDYTVTQTGQKITITLLSTGGLKTAVSEKDIEVTYVVTVNGNATIGGDNKNTATLTYGTYVTKETEANVKIYGIDVFKYTGTKTPLSGATFRLYKKEDSTPKYALVSAGKITGWDDVGTSLISPSDGLISIDGLDADTYFLEETAAPDGYNKLTAPIKVVISEAGAITYGDSDTNIDGTDEQIQVENKAGSLLPETGGIGTTIFYAAGALLVVAGVVVLVTRKRMENQ